MRTNQNHGAPPVAVPAGLAQDDESLSVFLRRASAFVRRRSLGIAVAAVLGAALAVVAVMRMDDLYQSEVLVRVEQPDRSPIDAEPVPAAAATDAFIEGQVYIIGSTEILRDAVARANLTEDPFFQRQPEGWLSQRIGALRALISAPGSEVSGGMLHFEMSPEEGYAVRTLRANLDVFRRGDTELLTIRVTADGARRAARIATAVGEAFVANREGAQFDQASRVAGWLDDRALELQRQLGDAEDAVTAFRIENGLFSTDPDTTLGGQQLSQLNGELIATRVELAQSRASLARFRAVVEGGGDVRSLPEVQGSDLVGALRAQLLGIEQREAELTDRGQTNPRVTAIRDERMAVEAQLADEVGSILEGLANQVETLETRERLMGDALAQAGGATGIESQFSVELRELERRAAAYRALYERYLSNVGLADESVSYLTSGVEIVDPANVPQASVYPPRKLFVLFGLLFGGAIGALVALVREAMLPGFMTARRVEQVLGLPVLACVPKLPANPRARNHALNDPLSAFGEAVANLRHGLTASHPGPEAPVLLITSSSAGEGKTSLSSALAQSAAAGGQNVLLIDADLRRGGLTRLYEAAGDPGLTDILRAGQWAYPDLERGAGTLDILPTGAQGKSPTDLLARGKFDIYLDDARMFYDLIVIDGPPVANMADAAVLARLSDAVAFVVGWNDTPREVVSEAIARIDVEAGRIGVALNAVDLKQAAQYGETYEQYVQTTGHQVPRGAHA